MVVNVGCVCCVCRWHCGVMRNCSAWFVLVNGGAKCILMGVVFL